MWLMHLGLHVARVIQKLIHQTCALHKKGEKIAKAVSEIVHTHRTR